jgi:hypothetical protein
MYRRRRPSLEEVNGMETVLEIPATDVALSEPLAAPAESLSSRAGETAENGLRSCGGFLGLLFAPPVFGLPDLLISLAPPGWGVVLFPLGPAAARATSALAGDLGYTSYPHRRLS